MSPVSQFTLDDVRVLPIGSGYCQERWRLYRVWELELDAAKKDSQADPKRAYREMVRHMRGCGQCRRHAQRMDALASQAVYPDVKLPDWY